MFFDQQYCGRWFFDDLSLHNPSEHTAVPWVYRVINAPFKALVSLLVRFYDVVFAPVTPHFLNIIVYALGFMMVRLIPFLCSTIMFLASYFWFLLVKVSTNILLLTFAAVAFIIVVCCAAITFAASLFIDIGMATFGIIFGLMEEENNSIHEFCECYLRMTAFSTIGLVCLPIVFVCIVVSYVIFQVSQIVMALVIDVLLSPLLWFMSTAFGYGQDLACYNSDGHIPQINLPVEPKTLERQMADLSVFCREEQMVISKVLDPDLFPDVKR